MTELRLEFHLPQFLLPEDWAPEGEEEEGNPTDKLGAPSVSQGSLLGEDTLSSFTMDLCSSMDVSSEPFPCLADELEQQAKALEREWYCPEEPAVVAPTRSSFSASLLGLSSAAPALKHSSLHLRQQQLSELAAVKDEDEEMACQGPEDGCGAEGCEEGEESIPPCTPTKRSQGHNSSWNESQCTVPVMAADPQEVQSPARPPALLAPLPHLPAPRLASLSLAVNNAQSIRLRGQPLSPAAWRGCIRSPWCNREVRHRGPCNHRAAVPGLLAYSQSQLFESGVNVDELCRAPELAAGSDTAPMFCNSAQSALATSAGVEGSPLLTKRKADFESDVCGEVFPFPCPFPFLSAPARLVREQQQEEQQQPAANQHASSSCPPCEPAGPDTMSGHSQQGSRAAERSSSECGQPQQRQEHSAERPKRQRLAAGMACEAAERAGSEAAQQGSSGFIRPSEAGDAAELQRQASVDHSPTTDATPPPAAAEPLAAEATEPTPAAAAAAAAADLAAPAARTGLRSKAGGQFGSRARRTSPTTAAAGASAAAGQQAAAPVVQLQSPTPASRGASKSSTPSKQPSRQLPKTPDAATPGVRTNQRRVILQWNADQVTDPRSGKLVCHVDPATFCTQCFVTHTPVWRAGPFGVKTLCNACGVRYMKYVGKNKK